MKDELRDILCEPDGEGWSWEPFFRYSIKFNTDGTGELFCIQETTYLCALNFEWKSFPAAQPAPSSSLARPLGRTKPELLGTCQLEITLKQGVAPGWMDSDPSPALRCHERYLLDTAYRPRSFNITIEKGNFVPASRIGREERASMLRYGLRLVFDRSPFPSLENWTSETPPVGPADREQPPMVDFVARQLSKSECKGFAMNDNPSAYVPSACVVS